jgi:hypothetical protein
MPQPRTAAKPTAAKNTISPQLPNLAAHEAGAAEHNSSAALHFCTASHLRTNAVPPICRCGTSNGIVVFARIKSLYVVK